jgi:hypothetical protein
MLHRPRTPHRPATSTHNRKFARRWAHPIDKIYKGSEFLGFLGLPVEKPLGAFSQNYR